MIDNLVAELTRLAPEERDHIVRKATAQRKRRIRLVIGEIRRTHLSSMAGRAAAREIAAAVNGRRAHGDAVLRRLIVSRLKEELGHLDDLPGESTIRHMPEFT